MAFGERGLDQFFLLGNESFGEWLGRPSTGACPSPEPALIDGQVLGIAHDDGPFNHVLQFSNVARPCVRLEEIQAPLIDSRYLFPGFAGKAIDEVFHEQRDVFFSLAKRRDFDWEHIQPIKEILAEPACGDGSLQVAICGRHDPNVDLQRLICVFSAGLRDVG